MRLDGEKIEGPNIETIILPRAGDRKDIVLKAQAILDYDDFDAACPRPKPPVRMLKGGVKQANPEDPRYKEAIEDYNTKRLNWMIIKSLQATEKLEWDLIDLGNQNTWNKLDQEFKEAGFSEIECGRIRAGVFAANCLSEEKLEEARASFLLSQQQPPETSFSLRDEQSDTPSGVAANAWESDLPVSVASGTAATSGSKPVS